MKNDYYKKDQNLIDVNEVEIVIKIKGEGKLKATAILKYKNIIIKGFRITDSKYTDESGEKIWIQPPSFFTGHYQTMFFLEPKEEWEKLKDRIIKQFKKCDKEYYNKKFKVKNNERESIDIENIKF